ncbi:hypothetical protein BD779DRAFT_1482373, partial [Infundibulicybe gibba]
TTGDQPKLRHMNGPPPPISIFFRTVDPIGVAHHVIWPAHFEIPATTTRAAETRYFYNLDHVTDQSFHVSTPHVTHVLPGAYRALMYTISSEDRKDAPSLVSLRRYINPEIQYTDYPVPKVDTAEPVTRRERHPMPWNVIRRSRCHSTSSRCTSKAASRRLRGMRVSEGVHRGGGRDEDPHPGFRPDDTARCAVRAVEAESGVPPQ